MQSEQVLRQTIRHLREAEVSAENISEAIMLLSLFSGPLVTTKALKITHEISEELKDYRLEYFCFNFLSVFIKLIAGGLMTVISRNPVHSVYGLYWLFYRLQGCLCYLVQSF